MGVVFLLGFSSGLPLFLVGSTLQYLMTDAKEPQDVVASVASIGVPYTFKFLWAPAVDRFEVLGLGRRRGWLLLTQLGLAVMLLVLGTIDPATQAGAFYLAAFVTSFIAATQDIVVDAYTTDLLEPHERAMGAAATVLGYRTAMLIAGSFALVLAGLIGWTLVYVVMALLVGVGITGTLLAEEPLAHGTPRTLDKAVAGAFTELFGRLGWRAAVIALAFALTYKFAEQFAIVVLPSFYRMSFSKNEIALVNKAVGYIAIVAGSSFGSVLVAEHGLRKTLVWFGILQAITHVAYIMVARAGHDLLVFGIAIGIENVTAQMATMAFVAALMGFCNTQVSATQYALLTSLSGVGNRVVGRFAGDLVGSLGYQSFFTVTIAMAIPGIILAHFAARISSSEVARRAMPH